MLLTLVFRLTSIRSGNRTFSPTTHDKMVVLNRLAARIFEFFVCGISKSNRYDYTIQVDYEGCKVLIRPFLFSELIMVSGHWEPYVKQIFDRELGRNDVLIDVGASIGVYAVTLAKRVRKIIAFEPHPKTSEILEKNIKLNHLDNVKLVKRVVGNSKQRVVYGMSVDPYESGVVKMPSDKKLDFSMDDKIETECVDLDTYLGAEDRIDWLLIDAEGFELNVLKGAMNLIRKFSPRIIFESYPHNIDEVREILVAEGFSITQLYAIYYYANKKVKDQPI